MSTKKMPTLRGIFPEPRVAPKRDFLKENKLKVKEMQNTGSRRKVGIENDLDSRRMQGQQRQGAQPLSLGRRIPSCCSCISKNSQTSATSSIVQKMPQKFFCNKNTQTDEISDEEFLSNALMRCSSIQLENKPHTEMQSSNLHNLVESKNNISSVNTPYNGNVEIPLHDSGKSTYNQDHQSRRHTNDEPYTSTIPNKIQNHNDIKSRKDIKIPKYLEREKREKELQRLREMERDPQCPDGYLLLSEGDRIESLKAAESQFQALISELNHMPMTSETLRVRARKMEIEKALIILEDAIRRYSKDKVYVKADS